MASSAPLEIASTLQTASLNRAPSPHHDLNPPTAASAAVPVAADAPPDHPARTSPPSSPSAIPLRPRPRRPTLPPLPDLRFEQSYLASIPPDASWARAALLTAWGQVLLPLLQGTAWTLALAGWRHWHRGANHVGSGIGARLRRWWWEVNKWETPRTGAVAGEWERARRVKEVRRPPWEA